MKKIIFWNKFNIYSNKIIKRLQNFYPVYFYEKTHQLFLLASRFPVANGIRVDVEDWKKGKEFASLCVNCFGPMKTCLHRKWPVIWKEDGKDFVSLCENFALQKLTS